MKMFLIFATILVTIIAVYMFIYGFQFVTPSNHVPGPDEVRFYRNLSTQNRKLRPDTRQYYEASDVRVPDRIRVPVTSAFKKALHDFPLKFPITQPVLIFASGDTEGGMPHTLDNRIIVPLRESIATDPASQLWTTMIHEMCHIHQRQDPAGWGRLYTQLGFVQLTPDTTPSALGGDDVVANPDAGSGGMPQIGWWSYKGQVGVLVFTPNPNTIRDHHSVVYPVTTEGAAEGTNQLKEAFGELCGQYDHPNEVTACLIANHWDSVVRPSSTIQPHDPREIVRQWLLKEHSN